MLYLPDETTPDKPYSIERIRPEHALEAALTHTWDCPYGLYNTPDYNLHPRLLDRILLWAWEHPWARLIEATQHFQVLVDLMGARGHTIRKVRSDRWQRKWQEQQDALAFLADRKAGPDIYAFLLLSHRRETTRWLGPIYSWSTVWTGVKGILNKWEKAMPLSRPGLALMLAEDYAGSVWIQVHVGGPGGVTFVGHLVQTMEFLRHCVRLLRRDLIGRDPMHFRVWMPVDGG